MGYQFTATCPHCQTQLQLDSDWIGITVQCAQCGKRFCVEEPSVPQALPTSMITPPGPHVPDKPMTPPEQPGTQNKSTAGMVWGITGLIPGIFISPIGFILSLTGLIIGSKKKSKISIVLGTIGLILNFLLSILFFLGVIGALVEAKETAQAANCMNNMKQLGCAFMMYSADHREHLLPPYKGENGMELLHKGGYIFGEIDKCPSDPSNNSYAYIGEGLYLSDTANTDLPILIEFPNHHTNGRINVLHLGAHVTGHNIPANFKTIYQITEYLLAESNVDRNDKNALKVLENAKKFK